MTTPGLLTAEDRESVRHLVEVGWPAAVRARDWDKALAICAPDIVYMPADHPALHGHAALRAWLDLFPPILHFKQSLEAVDGDRQLAIARGSFTAAVDAAGHPMERVGKFLSGWRHDAAGRWVLQTLCWSWDQPAP